MNKDTVIEALIERFAPLRNKFPGTIHEDAADLIRASCENIYQWGRLQGMNEVLLKMQEGVKWEKTPDIEEMIELPCLYCSKLINFKITSNEARGIFNVFCSGDCEDRYSITR